MAVPNPSVPRPKDNSRRTGQTRGVFRPPVSRPSPAITEAQFQRQVVDLARLLGWDFIYHPFLSKWSEMGWPDLFLARVRDKRVMWAELKSERGKLTGRQAEVVDLLRDCGQLVCVWRPSDIDTIAEVLR
jgi:VRR-NUC domain